MRIVLGQLRASPDKQQNLESIASVAAEAAADGAALVLFPETAMAEVRPGESLTDVAEPLDGPFARALSSLAAVHNLALLVGMLESIPGSREVFNTVAAFAPDGAMLGAYRKIHLYDAFGFRESDIFQAGSGDTLTFRLGDVSFGVETCYDIRFPELTRRLVEQGAECILVPAAWVQGPLKESHWETLLRARALENTVYVAGAGLVGPRFCGNSMLVDPMGIAIARAGEASAVVRGEVRPERVQEVRRVNPSLANARPDVYRIWLREPLPS
jgi:predicted amidohydrolase